MQKKESEILRRRCTKTWEVNAYEQATNQRDKLELKDIQSRTHRKQKL